MDLAEVRALLNYKDLRSVQKWCAKQGIMILKVGGAMKVAKLEFLLSFYKPFIQHLKSSFPKKWKELFLAYLNGDVKSVLDLSEKGHSTTPFNYKPKHESEKVFLNLLKDL